MSLGLDRIRELRECLRASDDHAEVIDRSEIDAALAAAEALARLEAWLEQSEWLFVQAGVGPNDATVALQRDATCGEVMLMHKVTADTLLTALTRALDAADGGKL